MNSKERVLKTFNHEEPDRVPITELYINSPVASDILGREAWTGWGGYVRAEIYTRMLMEGRAEEFFHKEVCDLVELYRKLELDTVMIERPPLRNLVIPTEIAANTWRYEYPELDMWNVITYCPETDLYHEMDSSIVKGGVDAFEKYVSILESSEIDLTAWNWSQAEYIVDSCGHDKFLMGVVEIDFPPMSFNSWGGIFLECMIENPDVVERYLDYRVRKGLKFVEKFASMGVDAVFDGEDLAGTNGPLFSPAFYRKFYMPRLRQIAQACQKSGMVYVRHTDGNIMSFADEFLTQTGIDAYHSIDPGAGMDISVIKQKYGGKITLWGNVDCGEILGNGTKDDIVKDVQRVIKTASPGGGHVLTSSNTIHSDIPTENFITMLEAARKFGKYPIDLE